MSTDQTTAATPPPGPATAGRGADLGALARGGTINLVGAVVSAAANFLLVVVVVRHLDQAAAGVFFTVTSLFLLAEVLCRLGADLGLVYFVARWRALERPDRLRPSIRAALGPTLTSAVAVAVLLLVFAAPLADRLAEGADRADTTTLIRLVAAFLPVAVLLDLALAATRGFDRMRPTVLLEKILRPGAQLLLVLGVLLAGVPALLGAAWALPYALAAGLAWLATRRLPWPGVPAGTAEGDRREVRRAFWGFSAPRAAAGVAQILMQRLDILLVAALRGPRDAAIYTAATRFLVAGQFVNQALSAPVQPQLSRLLARGEIGAARLVYRTSTAWLVLGVWPVFLLSAVFAPQYLAVFGTGYGGSVTVVVLLSLTMLVASGCGLVDIVLIMAGRTTWNLLNTVLALLVNVTLDLLLIPSLGVLGAAIGWAAGILVANLVPLAQVRFALGLHPYGPETWYAAALAAACFAGVPLLGGVAGGTMGRVGGAVAGSAVYAAGLWRGRRLLQLTALARRRPPAADPSGADPAAAGPSGGGGTSAGADRDGSGAGGAGAHSPDSGAPVPGASAMSTPRSGGSR